jgi:hypothetical protein
MIWFLKSGFPVDSYGAYASNWHLAVLKISQIRAISNCGSVGDFDTKVKGHLKYFTSCFDRMHRSRGLSSRLHEFKFTQGEAASVV